MLALIAGTGGLPAAVVAECRPAPLVCALKGFEPDTLTADLVFRLETLGSLLAELKARGVTEVCLAGAIRRPPVDPAAIDAATLPLVPVIQQALASGDDGALRAVIAIFEGAGMQVRAAHEIAPALLPEPGLLSGELTDADRTDAARAATVLTALAAQDVGQGCVAAAGQVIAVEALPGTDWMLESLRRYDAKPPGGVLLKAPKAGQDRRADLPAIGPGTIRNAAAAGLRGVAVEAGGVMVLDRVAVLDECARTGLFLWVREPG